MSVLTPELASMLIQDDLKIDDEQARDILERSDDLGSMLNDVE
jgi:hypothetical protein